jgi:hypothetical protein
VCRAERGFLYAVEAFNTIEKITYSSGELVFAPDDEDFKLVVDDALLKLLRNLFSYSDCFAAFILDVGHQNVTNENQLQVGKELVYFSFSLSENMVFCDDLKEYVSIYSSAILNDAAIPKYFYLRNSCVLFNDEIIKNKLENIRRATLWVNLFEKISDINKLNEDGGRTYYFLVKGANDSYSKPMEIEVKDLSSVVDVSIMPELGAFDALLLEERVDLNDDEKRSFFKLAMVDTLRDLALKPEAEGKDYLTLALGNIDSIKTSYFDHYEIFIHNFALGEFYREVEGKYFDYVEKIQSVLGDIQTKIFAIPAALIGMGALSKVTSMSGNLLILLGVFLVSLMTVWLLRDQKIRLGQIKASMKFVFNKIRRDGEGNEEARVMKDVSRMRIGLEKLLTKRSKWIDSYMIMAWIPFVATSIAFLFKKWDVLLSFGGGFVAFINRPVEFATYICSSIFCC